MPRIKRKGKQKSTGKSVGLVLLGLVGAVTLAGLGYVAYCRQRAINPNPSA